MMISARNISRSFLCTLTRAKFENACNKLEQAGFGRHVTKMHGQGGSVFIKKNPEDVVEILQKEENADLCSWSEYSVKFNAPLPASITPKLQAVLAKDGLLPPVGDMK